MPYFNYFGRDIKGEVVQGNIERADSSSVVHYLVGKKVTPIRIEQTEKISSAYSINQNISIGSRIHRFFQKKM